MDGEQLCYMHRFVHRSLLYSIGCCFRLHRLLSVVPFTAHHFYLSSSAFVFKPISSCAPSHSALEESMDYLAEIYLHYKTIHIDELIGPKGK